MYSIGNHHCVYVAFVLYEMDYIYIYHYILILQNAAFLPTLVDKRDKIQGKGSLFEQDA